MKINPTSTLSVRVKLSTKKQLAQLAKSTGRSRAFLAAEAIEEYLEVNEWQVARIKQAIKSLDAGKRISHEKVVKWIKSWGSKKELPMPQA